MATVDECRQALERLAGQMSGTDGEHRGQQIDRTLACHLTDLDVDFRGRLAEGTLIGIEQAADPKAKIKLTTTSDDLVALTNGQLNFATAWASGRLKVDASVFDLLKLRSLV
jgi:predicted lipid carrier protein YhbT